MDFKITKLYLDTNPYFTSSFSNVVYSVKYKLTEAVGEVTSSVELVQPMEFIDKIWATFDSSSFIEHNSLTEDTVKGWVTSSYASRNTEVATHGKVHPTGSWENFISSMSSSLHSESVDNGILW
jgi:hypothetical protein